MGKALGLILAIILFNLGIFMFAYQCDPGSAVVQSGNSSNVTYYDESGNICEAPSMVDYLFNVDMLENKQFLNYFIITLGSLAGAVILVGVYLTRSLDPIWATMGILLMTAVLAALVPIWSWIYSQPYLKTEGVKILVSAIFTGTLSIATIFTMIDWIKGKD